MGPVYSAEYHAHPCRSLLHQLGSVGVNRLFLRRARRGRQSCGAGQQRPHARQIFGGVDAAAAARAGRCAPRCGRRATARATARATRASRAAPWPASGTCAGSRRGRHTGRCGAARRCPARRPPARPAGPRDEASRHHGSGARLKYSARNFASSTTLTTFGLAKSATSSMACAAVATTGRPSVSQQVGALADQRRVDQRLVALHVDDDVVAVQAQQRAGLGQAIAAAGVVDAREHGLDAVLRAGVDARARRRRRPPRAARRSARPGARRAPPSAGRRCRPAACRAGASTPCAPERGR